MKKITFLFLFATISIASYSQFSANLLFTTHLTGEQEVPAVTTTAEGVASFILNATHDTMCVKITVMGLSGAITSAQIYLGDTGATGTPLIPLTNINGYDITATLTTPDISPANIASFLNGSTYLNIQTAANPNGEIRGQIMLESDHQFVALIEPQQEVPPVLTPAIGMVIIDVYRNMERADIFAQFTGIADTVTGFSLYQGTPSVNGPILANYDTSVSGNSINIEVEDSAFLNDLMAGNVYVNVLTSSYPTGQLRGQFTTSNKLTFDVLMSGLQETPPTTSAATGLGTITINGTMDTLWYDIIFDSLTATPTAAHFHVGAEGVPGPVVLDLTPSIVGNRITGFISASIPIDFINNALMGNIYVNIHNLLLPNGEIRGQLDRYAREGFTYAINASQETPATTSTATGSGFLSLDREKENVHFEAVVNGLSGDVTAAHFHNAPIGVAGPVIFPLIQLIATPNDSVAIMGDWTDDDLPPFDTSAVSELLSNNVYINFHTAANPAGEVRGQVIQGGDCFVTIVTAVTVNEASGEFNVYPVPSSDYVSVTYTAKVSSEVEISVFDVNGRVLSAEKISATAGANKVNLDISKFNPGIYFIKINNSGKQMFYGKLIKG